MPRLLEEMAFHLYVKPKIIGNGQPFIIGFCQCVLKVVGRIRAILPNHVITVCV